MLQASWHLDQGNRAVTLDSCWCLIYHLCLPSLTGVGGWTESYFTSHFAYVKSIGSFLAGTKQKCLWTPGDGLLHSVAPQPEEGTWLGADFSSKSILLALGVVKLLFCLTSSIFSLLVCPLGVTSTKPEFRPQWFTLAPPLPIKVYSYGTEGRALPSRVHIAGDRMPTLASVGSHIHVVPCAHTWREFVVLEFSCRSLIHFNFVWSDLRGALPTSVWLITFFDLSVYLFCSMAWKLYFVFV